MPWIKKRETRTGTRWDVRVYVGGEKKYIEKTYRDERAAKRWAREQEARKDRGERPTTDRRSLAQYVREWLTLKAEGAVADRNGRACAPGPRTMDDYQRLATDWIIAPRLADLVVIGRTRIDRVSFETLNQLYKAMKPHTTVGTVKKLHRLLGQAFVEAERKGILARNPADLANVPQVAVSNGIADSDDDEDADASASAMTEQQAEAFLAASRALADEQESNRTEAQVIPERCWSALWHVLLGCGLRPGEAFALHWSDLDEIAQAVQIRRNLVRIRGRKGYELRKPKTRKSRRKVPLPLPVWEELKRWRREQKRQRLVAGTEWQDLGFVFTTSKGTPLHGARRAFVRVSAKAGVGEWKGEEPPAPGTAPYGAYRRQHPHGPLPARDFAPAFRIYDLRHTYVTLLLMKGVPVNVVADLVGHETASFTITRYGHALPKQTQEAVAMLEAVLFATG